MKPVASNLQEPASESRRQHFLVRHRKPLLVGVVMLLCLAIGIRALLPLLVERGVAWGSRYFLGLPARIANVDLVLLRGIVVLEGLVVGPTADDVTPTAAALHPPELDSSTALLQVGRLVVDLSWRDLFKKQLRLTELAIESPSVRLVREKDGVIDPLRHARPRSVKSSTQDPAATAAPPDLPPLLAERLVLLNPSVVIVDATGKVNLLEFSLRSFGLSDVSLIGGDFALGKIAIHDPELRVNKELLTEAEAAEEKLADSPPAIAPDNAGSTASGAFRLKNIFIENARFTWLSKEGPLEVGFTFEASEISTAPETSFPIDLAISLGRSSVLLKGAVGILPPAFHGEVVWKDLAFPPLLLAARPELASWLQSADSSGDIRVEATMGGNGTAPGLRISGRATLDDFAIADPAKNEVSVEWEQVEVSLRDLFIPLPEEATPLPTITADLPLVRLTGPKIRYTHPTSAFDSLLGPPELAETAQPPAASDAPPLRLAIGALEVNGADIELHDTSVKPPATSPVRGLSLSVKDLTFPDPRASAISLRATLPADSLLSIDGSLQSALQGTFLITLQELDLPSFSPYAMTAAGASLDAGRISVKTELEMQGPVIRADNDLVIRKVGVSLRNPESFAREFGMPIDLVIALLSDPAGDIRLTVPVRLDEKGASFSAGPVIGSAVKAAILGAVSSPLKLLGAGFAAIPGMPGTSSLSVAPINSLPGSPELAPEASRRLESLAKLLAQRPGIAPVFRGRAGPADHPFLAEQILKERLQAREGLPKLSDTGPLAALRMRQLLARRAKGDKSPLVDKDQALFTRYLQAVEIPPDRLIALANSRAEMARTLLMAKGVKANRVTIGPPEATGDPGVLISFGTPPQLPH